MSKHTEGPWMAAAAPSSIVGWPIVAPGGRAIASVHILMQRPAGVIDEQWADYRAEVEANVRLIAAAPELLPLARLGLKQLHGEWLRIINNRPNLSDAAYARLKAEPVVAKLLADTEAAKATIAKAEGTITLTKPQAMGKSEVMMTEVGAALAKSETAPMAEPIFWLSFCDPNIPDGQQFLGVAIVSGPDFLRAVIRAHDLQINPGGEVAGARMPEGEELSHALSGFRDRLLGREEAHNAAAIVDALAKAEGR